VTSRRYNNISIDQLPGEIRRPFSEPDKAGTTVWALQSPTDFVRVLEDSQYRPQLRSDGLLRAHLVCGLMGLAKIHPV